MTELRSYRRVVRNRKKNSVPLSSLRTSDVVKTVVQDPRRLEELVRMLEDKDRGIRGRAAATLARLSESHPRRLLRVLAGLRDALSDDSAYVRWYVVYALGRVGSRFPAQSGVFISDLGTGLDDENRIVRILTGRALSQMAARSPMAVEELFQNGKREMPAAVARVLRKSKTKSSKEGNR